MPVCLLDLAGLRFERSADRTVVRARTAAGELIAVTTVTADTDARRAAAAVCDAALAAGTVVRSVDGSDTPIPVALYNPYSAEVAVAALPHTRTYGDGHPLPLPDDGAVADVDGDTLTVDGRTLPVIPVSAGACSHALAAHPDPS